MITRLSSVLLLFRFLLVLVWMFEDDTPIRSLLGFSDLIWASLVLGRIWEWGIW